MIYPQSGWYMASTSTIPKKYRVTLGHIEGQKNIRPVSLRDCLWFCLDNSVFTGMFDERKWIKRIESIRQYKNKCLFVVIPDVVGNFRETLSRFEHYKTMVTDLPIALVSQDGIKDFSNSIPWNDFDCLFVGGSDKHKLGDEGAWIIREAKEHNKWIHIGRVNSASRILRFWMADSWDGTHLSFAPSRAKEIHAAVLQVRAMKQSKGLFDEINP